MGKVPTCKTLYLKSLTGNELHTISMCVWSCSLQIRDCRGIVAALQDAQSRMIRMYRQVDCIQHFFSFVSVILLPIARTTLFKPKSTSCLTGTQWWGRLLTNEDCTICAFLVVSGNSNVPEWSLLEYCCLAT